MGIASTKKTGRVWTRVEVESLDTGDLLHTTLGIGRIITVGSLNPVWASSYAPYAKALVEVRVELDSGLVTEFCIHDGQKFTINRPLTEDEEAIYHELRK